MSSLFAFKSKLQDFIVDELWVGELATMGAFFYIQIEKKNKTTMEIVDHLMKVGHLPKKAIGFAGLKDKQGVTKQWLSVDGSIASQCLRQRTWHKHLCIWLSTCCTIHKTGWFDKPLSTKDDLLNRFTIVLRCNKNTMSLLERDTVKEVLSELFDKRIHLPNLYGSQRFGIQWRNVQEAIDILKWKEKKISWFDRIFKLQSLASHIWNECVSQRATLGQGCKEWDLVQTNNQLYYYDGQAFYLQNDRRTSKKFMVPIKKQGEWLETLSNYQIVVPVFGYNMILPPSNTIVWSILHKAIKKYHITEENRALFQELSVFGTVRTLWMSIVQWQWRILMDDLIINCTLPAWSYASVLVEEFELLVAERLKTHRRAAKPPVDHAHLPQHKQLSTKKPHRKWGKQKPPLKEG